MNTTIDPILLTAPSTGRQVRLASGRPMSRPAVVRAHRPRTERCRVRTAVPQARASAATFRRRRMAVVAALVFAFASILLVSGAFATEPSTANLQTVPRTHVVEAGDTLWSIAREYVPNGSISGFVQELARVNGVDIEVGQVIRIP